LSRSKKKILVGTKIDLRNDKKILAELPPGEKLPTPEMGENLAKDISAKAYLESSAFTQEGLKRVFEEAIRVVIGHDKDPKSGDKPKDKPAKKGGCALL